MPDHRVNTTARHSLSAVVIRADGTREDHGLIANSDLPPNKFLAVLAAIDPRIQQLVRRRRHG